MNRSVEKSASLRWKRCRRGLLFRNIKNGDGMILCKWLATSKKRGGYAELKYKIGTNCGVNTKLGNDIGGGGVYETAK